MLSGMAPRCNISAPDDAVQETSECTKTAPNIQAIDKKSVHRICSGQVVLTLATAVKELVENSIDAGATSVEVRLKDYGSESIEVIDNGSGVEERNFEGLTLKHHTSKLQDFDDLINVSTFGFRGEALSSLCALSNLIITTRHKSAAVATKLEFDLDGRITGRKSVPRQVGTTVLVQNIFFTLPVRHKEFHRVLKKEFAKLVQVLNAYCIVNTGVRISCSNQTAKGSRSTLVSTNGNEYIKENIANVFSPKQLQSVLEFRQMEPQDDVFSEFGIKPEQKCAVKFRIEGFVSKCEHGQGRSSTDRQFIFINKRPCDAAKILKLINEVYHMYNRHQNPFIALNICMDKESVDVNVTPDKRQIFMEGERLLLAVLKSSLIQMFEPTTSVYKVNTFVSSSQPYSRSSSSETDSPRIPFSFKSECQSNKELHGLDGPSLSSSLSRLKRSFSSAFARNDSSSSTTASPSKKNNLPSSLSSSRSNSLPSQFSCSDRGSISHFLSRFSPKKSTSISPHTSPAQAKVRYESSISGSPEEAVVISPILSMGNTEQHRLSFENPYPQPAGVDGDVETESEVFTVSSSDLSNNNLKPVNRNSEASDLMEQAEHSESPLIKTFNLSGQKHENFSEVNSNSTDHRDAKNSGLVISFHGGCCTKELPASPTLANCSRQSHDCEDETDGGDDENHRKEMSIKEDSTILTDLDFQEDGEVERQKKERVISFSFTDLRKRMEALNVKTSEAALSFSRSFRAKICPGDNKSAEDELQREISKDMFAKMKILGQFNLGFIITKLGSDLFIVDQHATDEKYNFEMLQRHTVLKSQRMILPQSLELTASNETILVDNLEVFKKNGFDFTIDPEAPPTQRVKLISAPVSKNWSFGKDDIEELLFMLTDSPNVMCRPSRVRMMFASRACRKSVMIGTALNKAEMKRLVCHMGEIEQPWNCPHGRPTMRHLFNMDMLPS